MDETTHEGELRIMADNRKDRPRREFSIAAQEAARQIVLGKGTWNSRVTALQARLSTMGEPSSRTAASCLLYRAKRKTAPQRQTLYAEAQAARNEAAKRRKAREAAAAA